MPSPVPPSLFKELIPSAGGSVCTKFIRNILRLLPERIYAHVSYERNPDGSIADGFAADIRALACFGGDGGGPGPGPGGLATPVISASDGTFLNKVQITWAAIVGATSYDVYRNETNTAATAVIIGSPTSSSWDDSTVVPGTTYYYWVRAKDATSQSNLSASNTGFAALTLPTITDLGAVSGFGTVVPLVWTPPPGAQKYDIFRNSVNNSLGATLIDSNRVPFDNSMTLDTGPTPTFIDNGGELVYYDNPPSSVHTYYYWVEAKSSSGILVSPRSNVAPGFSAGDGSDALFLSVATLISGSSITVPGGAIRAFVLLWGGGGAGAAGGVLYGGGGGGGGVIIAGKMNVAAGGKFRIVSTPEADTSRSAFETNGSAGPSCLLQYAVPPGTTFLTAASCDAPGGGVYNSSGGGLGGAGGSGSITGLWLSFATGIKAGRNGSAASGSTGGRSGYSYGSYRRPPANFAPGHSGDGFSPLFTAGAGSVANPAGGVLVEGGKGARAGALIYFFNA